MNDAPAGAVPAHCCWRVGDARCPGVTAYVVRYRLAGTPGVRRIGVCRVHVDYPDNVGTVIDRVAVAP